MLRRLLAGVKYRGAVGWLLFPLAAVGLIFAGSTLALRDLNGWRVTSVPVGPLNGADYSAWQGTPTEAGAAPETDPPLHLPPALSVDLAEGLGPQPAEGAGVAAGDAPPAPTPTSPPANAAPGNANQLNAPTAVGGAPSPTAPSLPAPTDVPPTAVPPTAVPPTAVPPTSPPPTAVPPTAMPPTALPPTLVPSPTNEPPTVVAPTRVRPTGRPPTPVPPTQSPPTDAPPTAVPPTEAPPPTAVTQVTLCHRPPGNPAKARTLTVAPEEVAGHLGHGDTLGPCP